MYDGSGQSQEWDHIPSTLHLFFRVKAGFTWMIFLVFIEQTPFTVIIPAASSDPLWDAHFSEFWAIEKEFLISPFLLL